MGAACCVAVKDKTIQHGTSGEILHRNFRHSPTWSFRWDNRVGVVAGEENSIGWVSDTPTRNNSVDLKSMTNVSTHVSDEESALENNRMGSLRKSLLTQPSAKNSRTSGHLIERNPSLEVKQSTTDSPKASVSTRSPRPHLAQQSLDIHNIGPNGLGHRDPHPSNESTRGTYARSSDAGSAYSFSELTSLPQRAQRSFDSDSYSVGHDNSGLILEDCQTCPVCSKLLTEKIMAGNELTVVAVLTCGHLYHAQCLETMTPEIDKYDPGCPVCTFGEKQMLKISGKLLKAERELKARNRKKSKSQFMDIDGPFGMKNGANEGRSPKLSTSSSLNISSAKPFLRRHFSFGSRVNKSALENPPSKKKGLFWVKSSWE